VALAESARDAMNRTHRAWHRVIWIALALAIGAGFLLALMSRQAPAAIAGPTMQERAR
jgi:hypothetical protein